MLSASVILCLAHHHTLGASDLCTRVSDPQMTRNWGPAVMLNGLHLVTLFPPGTDLDSGFELMMFNNLIKP